MRTFLHAATASLMTHFEAQSLSFHNWTKEFKRSLACDLPRLGHVLSRLLIETGGPIQSVFRTRDGQLQGGHTVEFFGFPNSRKARTVSASSRSHLQWAAAKEHSNEQKAISTFISSPHAPGTLANAVVARLPPKPIVSTAEEGTITIEPRSLIASYNMFMARKCRATGLF